MELFTQTFVVKTGIALYMTICPLGAPDEACIRASDVFYGSDLSDGGQTMRACRETGLVREIADTQFTYSFKCVREDVAEKIGPDGPSRTATEAEVEALAAAQ